MHKVLALFVALLLQATPVSAATMPFPDMEHSWYRYGEAVTFLRDRGIIGGYPDGTFRPKETINRAELLKIVFFEEDVSAPERRCFSDVNPDEWFAPYVCTAKSRGIIDGYADGTFQPGQPVNTAEAIKIILNTFSFGVEEGSGEQWYAPYVAKLNDEDILSSHSYLPWDPLNRERATDLLWRIMRHEEEGFVAKLSPGCNRSSITHAETSLTVEGRQRSFLLKTPSTHDAAVPAPLIVAFHGRTNSNEEVQKYYRLDREFPDAFIAYPAALQNENGTFSWSDPGDSALELRDIALFDAVVESLAEHYCIDMDRIFVVGHSLGAWFANSVACARGDVVRASATVGGDSRITNCAGPSAALLAHNPDDRLSPFSSTERTRELRIEENGCGWETEQTGPAYLSCVTHEHCAENEILWCPHTNNIDTRGQYYPHNWPKQTAQHIADFFASLP